jgi:hypothetical protein
MVLTQEKFKEFIIYEEKTGIFRWKAKTSKYSSRIIIGAIIGSIETSGYRQIRIFNKTYQAHRLAWLYVYGVWPTNEIDHINGIKDDNRLCNLREASRSENNMNQALKSNNTSGNKGIDWRTSNNKWRARITVNEKQIHIGYFNTVDDAINAYNTAALQYHGEFANINYE